MANVTYPAVIHKENSSYWVEFPDLKGCFASGETIDEAFHGAEEALGLYLEKSDDLYDREINMLSDAEEIMQRYKGEIVMLVECNLIEYAKCYRTEC